jgi:hypothetical protein
MRKASVFIMAAVFAFACGGGDGGETLRGEFTITASIGGVGGGGEDVSDGDQVRATDENDKPWGRAHSERLIAHAN